jgi:hypothetical protein
MSGIGPQATAIEGRDCRSELKEDWFEWVGVLDAWRPELKVSAGLFSGGDMSVEMDGRRSMVLEATES